MPLLENLKELFNTLVLNRDIRYVSWTGITLNEPFLNRFWRTAEFKAAVAALTPILTYNLLSGQFEKAAGDLSAGILGSVLGRAFNIALIKGIGDAFPRAKNYISRTIGDPLQFVFSEKSCVDKKGFSDILSDSIQKPAKNIMMVEGLLAIGGFVGLVASMNDGNIRYLCSSAIIMVGAVSAVYRFYKIRQYEWGIADKPPPLPQSAAQNSPVSLNAAPHPLMDGTPTIS